MSDEREGLLDSFFNCLISGDRCAARRIIDRALEDQALETEAAGEHVLAHVCWPALEQMQNLHRNDQISELAYHYGTRLLHELLAHLAARLRQRPAQHVTIVVTTGGEYSEELAGQIATILLEAAGYTVYFCGGGVPRDELVAELAQLRADKLVIFGATPQTVPATRLLISHLHEIGACPRLQVIVGGGVFNRAEGLAEVLGADLWANSPDELLHTIQRQPDRRVPAERRTVRTRQRARQKREIG